MSRLLAPALAALTLLAAAPAAAFPHPVAALVVHVDDGDTIDVRIGTTRERVRYIGVNAPEIGQPGALEATLANAALLGAGRVSLAFDVERRDRYGRLLAYVWVGRLMVNAELVRRGLAVAMPIPPNLRHRALFRRLEREARGAGRGLWRPGGSGDGGALAAPSLEDADPVGIRHRRRLGRTRRAISSRPAASSWSRICSITRWTPSASHRSRSASTLSGEP